jgi:hypothetical protein
MQGIPRVKVNDEVLYEVRTRATGLVLAVDIDSHGSEAALVLTQDGREEWHPVPTLELRNRPVKTRRRLKAL